MSQRIKFSLCERKSLVTVTKEILDRPLTTYALTAKGKTAFREYLAVLEQIVQTAQGGKRK